MWRYSEARSSHFFVTSTTTTAGESYTGGAPPRLKDQELILRFFALFEQADQYSRPVKGFLKEYLQDNFKKGAPEVSDLISIFEATMEALLLGAAHQCFARCAH